MPTFNNKPDGWRVVNDATYTGAWATDIDGVAGQRGTGSYALRFLSTSVQSCVMQTPAIPGSRGLYRITTVTRISNSAYATDALLWAYSADAAGNLKGYTYYASPGATNVWAEKRDYFYVPMDAYKIYALATKDGSSHSFTFDIDQMHIEKVPLWFNAWRTSTQSINSGGWPGCTKVQLNADTSCDPAASFDTSTNYRWTVPYDGVWQFTGQIGWSDSLNDQTVTLAQIRVNGTAVAESDLVLGKAHSPVVPPVVTGPLSLAAGDYAELYCYHDHGSSRNLNGGAGVTFLHGCEVG